jgi:hypothetical protein
MLVCIVVLVYCRVSVLSDVHTWSTYILSSCCIVMLSYVHTWSTYLLSILLRNHTWELHWSANDGRQWRHWQQWQRHTSNLYISLITCKSPVHSSTSICTYLIFTQKFLTAPTSLTMWSGRPLFKTNLSESYMEEWIIFAMTGISICSPLFKALLQLSCSMAFSHQWKVCRWRIGCVFIIFFWLGVTNDAAKPDCILPSGDDGSSYEGCSSGELIVI